MVRIPTRFWSKKLKEHVSCIQTSKPTVSTLRPRGSKRSPRTSGARGLSIHGCNVGPDHYGSDSNTGPFLN